MIRFNNLDQGYDQCTNLYNYLKTNGEKIATNLAANIDSLTKNWQGEDATLHINGLVKVYNGLTEFINAALYDTSYAISKIVEVQEVRHSNGSSGMVGTRVSNAELGLTTKNEIDGTVEYNCDPAANNDYQQLAQICTNFESFASTVYNDAKELMQNWLDGNDRDRVNTNFENFHENSENYKKVMNEAREALNTAVTNISAIM